MNEEGSPVLRGAGGRETASGAEGEFAGSETDAPRPEALARRRVAWFCRVWSASALALVGATWRLWTPQTVFPQVPLASALRNAPAWIDWFALAGMAASLVAVLIVGNRRAVGQVALWTFAVCVSGMFLLDQHRLQPWALQFLLIAVVLASRGPERSVALLRWLAVGIYFWSSLGKFDHTFLHGAGQQFLATIAAWYGASTNTWPAEARLLAASVFPAGELLVAVGLVFRRTRAAAVAGAVVMHLGLIAVLGPWGLDHQPGVLLWNVFFIAQAVLLFWRMGKQEEMRNADCGMRNERNNPFDSRYSAFRNPHSAFPHVTETLLALALLLPALEAWGWWDHWPSWGLYSTRAEGVVVLVHRLGAHHLPEDLQPYLREAAPGEDWRELEIDRWSLDSLGAPIYPQARFQLGVAEAVGRRWDLGPFIVAVRRGAADRWTGARVEEPHRGVEHISRAAGSGRLNGRPRWPGETRAWERSW